MSVITSTLNTQPKPETQKIIPRPPGRFLRNSSENYSVKKVNNVWVVEQNDKGGLISNGIPSTLFADIKKLDIIRNLQKKKYVLDEEQTSLKNELEKKLNVTFAQNLAAREAAPLQAVAVGSKRKHEEI